MSVICVGIVSFNTGSRLTYLSFQTDKAGRIMTEIEEEEKSDQGLFEVRRGAGGLNIFLARKAGGLKSNSITRPPPSRAVKCYFESIITFTGQSSSLYIYALTAYKDDDGFNLCH